MLLVDLAGFSCFALDRVCFQLLRGVEISPAGFAAELICTGARWCWHIDPARCSRSSIQSRSVRPIAERSYIRCGAIATPRIGWRTFPQLLTPFGRERDVTPPKVGSS